MDKDFFVAVKEGDRRLLKRVLDNPHFNVNCTDEEGNTPLFVASREGKDELVEKLLVRGADVSCRSRKDTDTPLIIACSEGYLKAVSHLIAAGAKIEDQNAKGWTPLIYAAYYGHVAVVQCLLDHNANVNETNKVGCSALYRASSAGHAEVVKLLIDAGADVNLVSADGRTPLSIATRWGYSAVVKVLLDAGAAVNATDSNGYTPLHEAVEYEHTNILEMLLATDKADMSVVDSEGRTPVMVAKNDKLVTLLLEAEQRQVMQNAIQGSIHESLLQLQLSQPQLTDLTVPQSSMGQLSVADDGADSSGPANDSINNTPPVIRNSMRVIGEHSHTGTVLISSTALSKLTSLAEASPGTIECLKHFGASAVQAELEYDKIRRDPTVYEYYLFFIQAVSSAVLASQSIASGMIADARLSSAEQVMQGIDSAAQAVSWMGAPLITGIGKVLVRIPNTFDRQRTIRRIATYFPSVDSHKYIEMLARELTIFLAKDTHAILREAKKAPKQSILDRVMKVVEWMSTSTNLTVVQGYACGHAAMLIDTMMRSEDPFAVELQHIPLLMHWASGKSLEEIQTARQESGSRPTTPLASHSPLMSSQVNAQHSSEDLSASQAEQSCGATPPVTPADKVEVDKRIHSLERKLSVERNVRSSIEQQQLREIAELKKQMKGLEAVTQIFSGISSAGGLVGAQSAESIHQTIENHLGKQAAHQTEQGELLRELAVRMELLIEDNNLRTPAEVQTSSGGGSAVYSTNKGAAVGEWVNAKVSYTADGTAPSSAASVRSKATPSTSNTSSGPQSPATRSDAADQELVGTGDCCVIS